MDEASTASVVIGMDPHKRSVTIEVMSADEAVVDRGRYGTDEAGFGALLEQARRWPTRVWAVEGCNGIGRHVATRLVAAGEQVLDVPPKLSRASANIRHRPRPQDRRDRRPLRGFGRDPDVRAATGRTRHRPGGAADPGRPAPLDR